jgi:membrane protease YdiL (CAAX protease family)
MTYPPRQPSITNPLSTVGPAQLLDNRSRRLDLSLLIETAVITIGTILTIRFLNLSSIFNQSWFIAPIILVAAALIPTVIKRRQFPKIGFDIRQIRITLRTVGATCIVVFPAMLCGLWLLKYWGFPLPLRTMTPPAQGWFCWLFYQFMYISVAEAVFFRGYVQSNILRLTNPSEDGQRRLQQWASIVITAVVFADAHIIVQGELISALTFLPGLISGWLFIRTKSLLAPILFHGLANTCYTIMTLWLM